ncbi:unnamed protein product, partial [Effrenium voratum]
QGFVHSDFKPFSPKRRLSPYFQRPWSASSLQETQTMRLMRTQVAKEWPGRRYDLIHCNCIHFCEELAQRLGVQPVPSWVRGLHETGAAAASVFRSFSKLLIDEPAQEVPNEQAGACSPSKGKNVAHLDATLAVACTAEAPGATDSKAPKDQVRIIIETDSKTGRRMARTRKASGTRIWSAESQIARCQECMFSRRALS